MPVVGKRKVSLFVLLFCLCLPVFVSHVVFALSENWIEVIRFEGNRSTQTELFTIDYVDWRIRWEYDPGHWHFPEMHTFQVITYPEGSSLIIVDMISGSAARALLNGINYVHENPGRFYMKIFLICILIF